MKALNGVFRAVMDLLFPPACESCGAVGDIGLCDDCLAQTPIVQPPYCAQCGIPFDPAAARPPQLCDLCRSEPPHFDAARAYGLHTGPLRTAVVAYKFKGRMGLADYLAGLMARRIALEARSEWPVLYSQADAIVPLPLHPTRRRWRGFDQAGLLAARLGTLMQVPVGQKWLCRGRHTAPQIGLTPTQRAENVRGAFTVTNPEQVAGKRLILVDDVLTTGATARDAARALKSARAAAVYLLTVSIAPPDWHPAAQRLEPPETRG